MSALFTPFTIKDITFRNRIGVSPMCQYSSVDGLANDWHMVHLGSRAVGGAGLIIAEATAVRADGRITPSCAGLWNDAQVEALIPINRFIADHGAVPAVQIGHAGRKGSSARPWDGGAHLKDEEGGWPIIGPAGEAFDDDGVRLWKTPSQMSKDDIADMQKAFVESAKRALAAGYQVLELHGAHGYLLHSFFTPLVNTRDDEYGGDTRGRARMMLETVDAVRAVWPENLPLGVRLSAADWIDGGLTVQDNIQMSKWLKERGVDFVDCSGGGATPAARASVGTRTADQVGLAEQIRAEAGIATMAVGAITDAQQAEQVIASGQADMVLLARQMLRDPYWPMHAAQELGADVKAHIPVQNGFFVG
ncbi:NADH:flavin oxidoreductase/NADH oxidase [Amylibacter sp. SFDW26]|uniref:NADH:flavin oxidoreductase/NADH oxidase n=1 Tax=Amylibacter sp. SFDW26 TaxID=2652722 RepID=UPI0012628D98|nr:NADH:flavin oxidoreductase/NADH oxidase [Amylibacter sp. SFDW26]KAB7614720.1 NADH:flavin oxidoreductase/NADH oxidase [Amylibacter sp. SFDW26]